MFYQRAANYRNLFDGTARFFRGRKADGAWRSPFVTNALVGDEYTEADAWQYAFGVQQDVPGMIALYGGDQPFIQKLDALFTADSTIQTIIPDISGLIGQYSQGDEQCHHVAYLYDYAGAPLQDPAAHPPGHGHTLQRHPGRPVRQRRLRPDGRLVRLQRAGLLPDEPRQRRLCHRQPGA